MQAEGFHTSNKLLSQEQVAEKLGTRAYCCAGERKLPAPRSADAVHACRRIQPCAALRTHTHASSGAERSAHDSILRLERDSVARAAAPLACLLALTLLAPRCFALLCTCSVQQPGVHRVWAARLVHAVAELAAAVEPHGNFTICTGTHVQAITQQRAASAAAAAGPQGAQWEWEVHTSQGIVRAARVVHCTNGYASGLLPHLLTQSLIPVRNQVRQPGSGARHFVLLPMCTCHRKGGNMPWQYAWACALHNVQVAATLAPYAPLSGRVDAAFYARGGYVYFSTREDGRVVVGGFRDVTPGMVCAACAGPAAH